MKTVIFDIDGTLANIDHRLHHIKNENTSWDAFHAACEHDVPKKNIIEFLRCMDDAGHNIILSSGRPEDIRDKTERWLEYYEIPFNKMFMRPNECYVPDNALKRAWLDKGDFGPIGDILFVVDDRDKMVQMWRGAGLTCLQVDQWAEEAEVSFPVRKIKMARDMAKFITETKQDNRFRDWRAK